MNSIGRVSAARCRPRRTAAGSAARRRRKRYLAADNDLTREQWLAIRLAWNDLCAYCCEPAESLQRDCVLPLSRGGRYTVDNVVPACRSCNASKCNLEATTWLRRKRLDERAFLLRHVEILATVSGT